MKNLSAPLSAHVAGEVTTLATCWKITRRDGIILGCTDHDSDIIFSGVTYVAATGFSPASISSDDSLKPDMVELQGLLSSTQITEADLMEGLYDFAEVEIFTVNYAAPDDGALTLRAGWIGEVRQGRDRFEAEMSGLATRLSRVIGNLYSPQCRASLGDAQCGVDAEVLTVTGTITAVTDRRVFADNTRSEAAGYFGYGQLTFTSGANMGFSMEVQYHGMGGAFELALLMPYDVAVGDAYSLIPGCDNNFRTCINKFSNAVNFRGEPHVPGTNKMLETAGTRS